MSLQAHIVVPERGVDAQLEVADGSTTVLFGRNGSGKSTILEAVAAMIDSSGGFVRIAGNDVSAVPARKRGIALVTQDLIGFDSMSVLDNVAFGPRASGLPRAQARAVALHWLGELGIGDLADRRPRHLSGGQARRMSIARALATDPAIVLLDEPMAGIDIEAASDLRALLPRATAGRTTVMATHDVLDAHLFADRVAICHEGSVVQEGSATDVLARPQSEFAARLAGRMLLAGRIHGSDVVLEDGLRVQIDQPLDLDDGTVAAVALTPSQLAVDARGWSARVHHLQAHDDRVRVHARRPRPDGGHWTLLVDVAAEQAHRWPPGADITLSFVGVATAYPLTNV